MRVKKLIKQSTSQWEQINVSKEQRRRERQKRFPKQKQIEMNAWRSEVFQRLA